MTVLPPLDRRGRRDRVCARGSTLGDFGARGRTLGESVHREVNAMAQSKGRRSGDRHAPDAAPLLSFLKTLRDFPDGDTVAYAMVRGLLAPYRAGGALIYSVRTDGRHVGPRGLPRRRSPRNAGLPDGYGLDAPSGRGNLPHRG